MFTLALAILVIWVQYSLKVQAQFPTDSIDYWIGSISPRCAVYIIYYKLTSDFIFNSTHNIPVMFVPLQYNRTKKIGKFVNHLDLNKHKFYGSGLSFMKSECYFSILYCKLLNDFDNKTTNDIFLYEIVSYIAYGFPNVRQFESNLTSCLILYHGTERNDEDLRFQILIRHKSEMNLPLVYLSNSSKSGCNVYCKTPSMKFQVAAWNVVKEVYSIVDQKFILTCSSQYMFVLINERNKKGVYDPGRFEIEQRIIATIFRKANVSMPYYYTEFQYGSPRVIVFDYKLKANLVILSDV